MTQHIIPRLVALAYLAIFGLVHVSSCSNHICGGDEKFMTEFTFAFVDSTSSQNLSSMLSNTPVSITYPNSEGFLSPVSISKDVRGAGFYTTRDIIEIVQSKNIRAFTINGGGRTLGTLSIEVVKRDVHNVSFNNVLMQPVTETNMKYYRFVVRD